MYSSLVFLEKKKSFFNQTRFPTDHCCHHPMVAGSTSAHLVPMTTKPCDGKFCLLIEAGQWFSSGITVSSTYKTDCQDTTEQLLTATIRSPINTHST